MNWKKPILIVLWSLVALAWLGVVGVYFTDPSKALWVGTVAGAAIISEIAVWTTAAILGLSVIESRKRIWARIRAPFGQR